MNTPIYRTIHPEVRVIDAAKGIVDYIASDETIDCYDEIIMAQGWRFSMFGKNSPFVDSHDTSTIEKLVGRVLDFYVSGHQLVERVQWAIDAPDNKLAQLGWQMTEGGYLKAVSVGFIPTRYVSRGDPEWLKTLQSLGLPPDTTARRIYLEQEQLELSSCIIGANPNALARAYKAGAITDDLLNFSDRLAQENASRAAEAAHAHDAARERQVSRQRFVNLINIR